MGDLTHESQRRESIRSLTAARIALPRTGDSIRTRDELLFQLDHAAARDAVHGQMNAARLLDGLRERQWPALSLQSAACRGGWEANRRVYLQRPDLGRRLGPAAAEQLRHIGPLPGKAVNFVIADGLSATAVERHALPFLDAFLACMPDETVRATPVCVVHNGRVAVGDEIGEALQAEVCVVLIGERPGLSSPDSMGVYVTWQPRVGRTDAERNCISNVRSGGLPYTEAAERLRGQLVRARQLGATGVGAGERRLAAASAVPTA